MSTPNVTRLAAQGMRAFLSYAPSAECSPSRAALMTGRDVGTLKIRGDARDDIQGQSIDLGETTIANVLQAHGYDTAVIGKWGLGTADGSPWNSGFGRFYGQLTNIEAWAYFPANLWDVKTSTMKTAKSVTQLLSAQNGNVGNTVISEATCPLVPDAPCVHSNDQFRDEAIAFIVNHAGANDPPFFLYWTPTAPHVGLYAMTDTESTSPVKRLGNRVGYSTECRRGHAAALEQHIDLDIKTLLDTLEALPALDERTLVIFASDNGAHQDCEDDPEYTVNWFGATAGLRGYKRTLWEGGLRSPTIFRWRGRIAPGTTTTFPHSLADLPLTFMELAGINASELPATGPLGAVGSGVSLVPMLLPAKGVALPQRSFMYFEWCAANSPLECTSATLDTSSAHLGLTKSSVLYKLIYFPSSAVQLFDLIADPFETNDLSALPSMQPVVSRLVVARQHMREPFCYGSPACCYDGANCLYLQSAGSWAPTQSASPSAVPSTSPTSYAPSTAPTLEAPSMAPSSKPTLAPSRAPTTKAPSIQALPTTVSPNTGSTLKPHSLRPTTGMPVAPHSKVPTTAKPVTDAPVTRRPTSVAPTTTHKPSTHKPATTAPTHNPTTAMPTTTLPPRLATSFPSSTPSALFTSAPAPPAEYELIEYETLAPGVRH